ncbi:MAG: histidine ammonia-lyase [Bacteroidia bacterium]
MDSHQISNVALTLRDVVEICNQGKPVSLSDGSRKRVTECRDFLEQALNSSEKPVYGINTGFGSLCNIKISPEELNLLQENLVKSHACGTGDLVPPEIIRLMLFLKIQSLAYGNSGITIETLERLIFHFNEDLLPVVFEQGSLGASGDLAPLAHLSLPLLGLGDVWLKDRILPASEVLQQYKLQPLTLQAKEGLALLNGTQFMAAYGIYCLNNARQLLSWADFISAISLDAYSCKLEPFQPGLHQIRPHKGQQQTATSILQILRDSHLSQVIKEHVQDPYSFRCIPQVHGASKDAYSHVMQVFETEINSVTDNPNIFAAEQEILSGGNFHGQPLALTMDYLAMALAEIGNISERRIFQLVSGQRGLPAFLVARPGVNSGLMITQYTAAALVSQNKQLCTPASVDSITSSNGQEDHVSMGANAATKLHRIVNNVWNILSIELLTAAQALHFRRPQNSSPVIEKVIEEYRGIVPPIETDRVFHTDIEKTRLFMQEVQVPYS